MNTLTKYQKLTRSYYTMNKAKQILNERHLSTVYYLMVYPCLMYDITLLWVMRPKYTKLNLSQSRKRLFE